MGQKVPSIPVPRVYASERMGSRLAKEAGATGGYMLLEGFNGNTLQDVEFDICSLSVCEHLSLDLSFLLHIKLFSVLIREPIRFGWLCMETGVAKQVFA